MAAPTVTTTAPSGILAEAATGGGEVTNAGVTARTNIFTNPSFEVQGGTAGVAASWVAGGSMTGTPVYSLPEAGRLGGLAQRFQYTGVAGDAASKTCSPYYVTSAGSFAGGDPCTLSGYIKGALVGCTIKFFVTWMNGGTWLADVAGPELTITGTYDRYSLSMTAPASSTRCYVYVRVLGIEEGDTLDVFLDDFLIEKSAVLTSYFDGSSSGGYWTGTANASASVCDGITARGTCWSTAANPTTADSKTDDHSHATPGNVSTFTSAIAGLTPGAVYHARAYAVNADGTSYGADAPFAAHSSNLPVIGCAFIKGGRQCQ